MAFQIRILVEIFKCFAVIQTFGWPSKIAFSLRFPMFSVIRAFGWPSRFALSLRFSNVFCDPSILLAFKIRILADISNCFLSFKRLAGFRNSHYRCDFQVFSVIQAFGWPSKFAFSVRFQMFSVIQAFCWPSKIAFSLRFPNVFCDPGVWLAFKIRILAEISKCFL